MQTKEIVLFDPQGAYEVGTAISPEIAGILRNRGGQSLPYGDALDNRSAIGGYFVKRFPGGTEFDQIPRRMCPLVLYVQTMPCVISWRARIVPVDAKGSLDKPTWTIRLVGDSSQLGVSQMGLGAGDGCNVATSAQEPDQDGSWLVGGQIPMRVATQGLLGAMLYGSGCHARLLYCAIGQVPVRG